MIGDFTRENIAKWLSRGNGGTGIYGWEDFHAVCGGIDIPWATEDGKNGFPLTSLREAEARKAAAREASGRGSQCSPTKLTAEGVAELLEMSKQA